MRRTLIGQAVCWSLLIATVGLIALTTLDYWFEVQQTNRALGLALVASIAVALAGDTRVVVVVGRANH